MECGCLFFPQKSGNFSDNPDFEEAVFFEGEK